MAASRNRQSPDVVARLRQTLKSRLDEWLRQQADQTSHRCRVAIAFSGGRDSVALLHAAAGLQAELGLDVSALHVHHGLSSRADLWVAFAENFCKSLGVPLHVARVVVSREAGLGIEGAARAARYRAFSECPANLLLLAHHQDDQAETVLFNLFRGAGVHGASAMPAQRILPRAETCLGSITLGRPWLDIARAEINAYVAECGLAHIEDESNADQTFSRNHLRHALIPAIEVRYPHAKGSLARAARRMGEAAGLLDELADGDLSSVMDAQGLVWSRVSVLSLPRQKNLLRRCLVLRGAGVSSEAGLEEFLRQCREAAPDAQVAKSFGTLFLRLWQGHLYPVAPPDSVPVSPFRWRGEASFAWGGGTVVMHRGRGDGLRATLLEGEVWIRPRQGNESLRLHANGPSRLLRVVFQERGVPPWVRVKTPFLWANGLLLGVGGVGLAAAFLAERDEDSISFAWQPA